MPTGLAMGLGLAWGGGSPGLPYSALTDPNIAAYFDTEAFVTGSTFVSAWTSRSTGAKVASQGTISSQFIYTPNAKNGRHSMRSSDSQRSLSTAALGISGNAGVTMIVVASVFDPTFALALCALGAESPGPASRLALTASYESAGVLSAEYGTGIGSAFYASGASGVFSGWHVYGVRKSPGGINGTTVLSIDGTILSGTGNVSTSPNLADTGLSIGLCASDDTGSAFVGDMGNVLLFNADIGSARFAAAIAEQRAIWGI